jgi:hypothetical protein
MSIDSQANAARARGVARCPRFAVRTIRDGSVWVYGREFVASDRWLPYDGRLDGMRYAFGLYYTAGERLPFVSLWGADGAYGDENADWPGPECVDDRFPWEWWRPR